MQKKPFGALCNYASLYFMIYRYTYIQYLKEYSLNSVVFYVLSTIVVCIWQQSLSFQWHLKLQTNLYLSILVLWTLQWINPAIKCSVVLMAIASLIASNLQSKTELPAFHLSCHTMSLHKTHTESPWEFLLHNAIFSLVGKSRHKNIDLVRCWLKRSPIVCHSSYCADNHTSVIFFAIFGRGSWLMWHLMNIKWNTCHCQKYIQWIYKIYNSLCLNSS